jgi:hypothetical protein
MSETSFFADFHRGTRLLEPAGLTATPRVQDSHAHGNILQGAIMGFNSFFGSVAHEYTHALGEPETPDTRMSSIRRHKRPPSSMRSARQ